MHLFPITCVHVIQPYPVHNKMSQVRGPAQAPKARETSRFSGTGDMLPRKILDLHMRLNAISCILRAILAQNIMMKSIIILVNL